MTESVTSGDDMPLKEIHRRIIAELDLNPARTWSVAEAGSILATIEAIRKGREAEMSNVIHLKPRGVRNRKQPARV
jgi:hypothetical protein